ncbi:MAG: pyrroline-5-carboxylate reductase [Verrucomicrobiales bacterium]|nr:pyrroline-5-carboxylate reductase [Verrucomicrobiales bacterium]
MSNALAIGFLGAGRMATALAQGFIRSGLVASEAVLASDLEGGAREQFARATGARVTAVNAEVLAAPIVLLAVKPGQVEEVLQSLKSGFTPGHLLVSIAAGITVAQLANAVPAGVRVVRVMPNTPAVVGASATAFALGPGATSADAQKVKELFGAVGLAFEVKEALMDAVTGLSGSGPAYACLFLEAMSDGGVAAGLPREVATRLAAQTLLGTARMVLETGQHPGVLKDQVTSPGGTTIEGIYELEKAGFRAGVIGAVRAASEKSKRLGGR